MASSRVRTLGEWQNLSYEGLSPSPINWARMAAYIDGEGSILINPRGKGKTRPTVFGPTEPSTFYLKVTVSNTDVRLVEWIKQRFGGSWKDANTSKYYEGRNAKTMYHWSASSARAAWILYNCFEYFVIKREQAEIGIALQASMTKFIRGTGQSKSLPDHIIAERRELKRRLLLLKARGKEITPLQLERIAALSVNN